MPKVVCPCVECRWCKSNHRCSADYLRLGYSYTPTMRDGHGNAHRWVCDMYELSDEAKNLEDSIKETYKILEKNRKD